jgi:hypothetical protein
MPLVAQRKRPPLIVADTIIPREVRWLWYPYIPSSAASLIFGPGGHGKSHITVDIAAALSRGRPLPGQTKGGKPQKVLMLSAEDDFDAVLVPRLMRAGADLTKIAFPKDPFTLDGEGLKLLESYMHEFAATVVFIDPVVRYIGAKIDINKANQTREFTGGLHEMAMKKQSSVIIVGHSRKGREDDNSEDWEKAMGSADFSNAVRSVMFVTKSGDGSKVMRHVKANYSPLGPTLGFSFGDHGFTWTGEVDEASSFQQARRTVKKNASEDWLRQALSNGPVRAPDIERLAKAAGLSMRTLNRVKPHVAESYMQNIDGKPTWFWTLRSDVQPVGENDNEISVQGLDDEWAGDERPASDAGGGRRSSGRGAQPKTRGGHRASVRKVGGRGSQAGEGSLHSEAAGSDAQDPKAIARAFLREHGIAA